MSLLEARKTQSAEKQENSREENVENNDARVSCRIALLDFIVGGIALVDYTDRIVARDCIVGSHLAAFMG